MNKRELKTRLRRGFTDSVPSSLPDDISLTVPAKTEPLPITRKSPIPFRKITAVAAAVAVVAVGATMMFDPFTKPPATNLPAPQAADIISVVSLDVNPSVDIKVNQNEEVIAVTPLNEDGIAIVGDQNFEGMSLHDTVDTLIVSMIEKGYISEFANSVLVSVDSEDNAEADRLKQKLSGDILNMLGEFDGAILSQTVTLDPAIEALAAEYHISRGKAMLIARILELDATKTFADLAVMKINDLNLIIKTLSLPNVDSRGEASDKAYLGSQAAIDCALAAVGVTADDITELEVEFDSWHGAMCYEVEFIYNAIEYEIAVDAKTGDILEIEKETADEDDEDDEDGKDDDRDDDEEDDDRDDDRDDDDDDDDDFASEAYRITADEAKAVALADAHLSADNVTSFDCERDREKGKPVYDIEFVSGDSEYEYTVCAESGTILNKDITSLD
ncbi:MAG: PepSY domain-containing protein [Clostridia bacterium]|nr:PepSY domain-containing protein [Clostridia bacterium]